MPAPTRPARGARALLASAERFLGVEAIGALVLFFATSLALAGANSPWSAAFERIWSLKLGAALPGAPDATLRFWVNDGFMTVFFLVVGLEIRRELHDGALSRRSAAALPVLAALGGVLVPAVLYLAIAGTVAPRGWAVPTATDIAFAVGVLGLMGRMPRALRVLLLTLAIVDDIVAITVIALFYNRGLHVVGLLLALGAVGAILLMQRLRVRQAPFYALPGALVWLGLLNGGVHPTLAGVVLGLITPVREGPRPHATVAAAPPNRGAEQAAPRPAPHERVEDALHPWVAYGVMPLFALCNAGVDLHPAATGGGVSARVTLAIVLALVLGKPAGIVASVLLATGSGMAVLPRGVRARHLVMLGVLGGIGFTMSLFIAPLAFEGTLLASAKRAVLVASALAAVAGLVLAAVLRPVSARRRIS